MFKNGNIWRVIITVLLTAASTIVSIYYAGFSEPTSAEFGYFIPI